MIEDNNGLVSKYAHCYSLLVSTGQEVKKGEIIAKSGNSGNSTGSHLHLEVIKNDEYLNPLYFAVTKDTGKDFEFPEYGNQGSPMGNGNIIYCGDPIQYTSINTSYWQNHFYSFRRLN